MIFIAFLRAHSGEVYLNNFMQGKVDVSRALGSGAAGVPLQERGPGHPGWATHAGLLFLPHQGASS